MKDYKKLFEQKSNSEVFRRSLTPKTTKFETIYKPAYRLPEIEMRGWSQRISHRKNIIGKPLNLGMVAEGSHMK